MFERDDSDSACQAICRSVALVVMVRESRVVEGICCGHMLFITSWCVYVCVQVREKEGHYSNKSLGVSGRLHAQKRLICRQEREERCQSMLGKTEEEIHAYKHAYPLTVKHTP